MQHPPAPSSAPISNSNHSLNPQFESLTASYLHSGITYKSNQILQSISQMKGYPYLLLIQIVKQFHMNQFQTLFFAHILNDEEDCFFVQPNMFETNMPLPQLDRIFANLQSSGQVQVKIIRRGPKDQQDPQQQDEQQNSRRIWSYQQLRLLFIYSLVIGYSIKYYLNQSTKAYQQQLKQKYPQFFTTIFNIWVDKYSNKVLRTNPRKINQFYIDIFQSQDHPVTENTQLDCQYRNYNQIVEELIKATTDGEDGHNGADEGGDYADL